MSATLHKGLIIISHQFSEKKKKKERRPSLLLLLIFIISSLGWLPSSACYTSSINFSVSVNSSSSSMASSNRHWPSMFKSKPCNTTTNSATTTTTTTNTTPPQWQHDINHACLVSSCQRPSPYSSSSGCEERTPEPKPRWNPKPEQIRILETIFDSGLVNPPRDEIRRIRAQLQEYGQVGDANVFYWFQNRKSRSKHKQKHLQNTKSSSSSSSTSSSPSSSHVNKTTTTSALSLTAPSSSSSSSSEKSSPPMCIDNKPFPMGAPTSVSNLIDVSNSPTASVNQLTYFQSTGEFTPHHHDPFFFPMQQTEGNNNNSTIFSSTQGFCFSHSTFPPGTTEQSIGGTCSGNLFDELMLNHGVALRREEYLEQNRKFLQEQQQLNNYMMTTTTTTNAAAASTTLVPTTSMITTTSSVAAVPISTTTSSTTASTIINQIQGGGVGESSNAMGGPAAAAKSTVFINDVAIEISVGPLNVRQTFGDDVVLIHPSGQPVLTNEWGVTLHSLTPGAFYYLVPITCCLVEED